MDGDVTIHVSQAAVSPNHLNFEPVDPEHFRGVIGRFTSGVTIVSTRSEDLDFGTTVSACTSISLEPAMIAVCLNRESSTQKAVLSRGFFGVSILSTAHTDLAGRFAGKGAGKFNFEPSRGPLGMPLIGGALAQIECELDDAVSVGTHTLLIGSVRYAVASDAEPLAYFRGRFGRFDSSIGE
ncbi:flavin reductase family protein [Rhodococcus pyridinivorans]|uniref:flavin reductase family protein n=1 Tax=Rhodococcus TaxID=1827 RepID=UPI0035A8B7DB